MEVITGKRLAENRKRQVEEDEVHIERAFEAGRISKESVLKVYETLLPWPRRVLSGPVLPSSSKMGSSAKESC
jgi:hypothetical protein